MRERKRRLKKLKPRIQMIAARNNGRKPTMAQFSVMPAPKTAAARNKRPSRSSSRYSSSDHTTKANNSNSNISDVQFVACSQKVICRPQTSTAKTGGSHALPVVKKENELCSRSRCASVRSCGKMATDRASRPSVNAAQPAEKRFNATGICPVGSQRNGNVTR